MNKVLAAISLSLLTATSLAAQGLYAPSGVQLKVGSSASLKIGGSLTNRGQVYDEGLLVVDGTVNNESRLNISNNASTPPVLDSNGLINNTGNLENVGLIRVSGNWNNTGIYNGIDGEIELDGTSDQTFSSTPTDVHSIVVNSTGTTLFSGDTVRVVGMINFVNGYVDANPGTYLVIEDGAEVLGGSDNSYSEGKLYHRGLGYKFFPVGNDALYLPVYLENVFGENPLIGVEVGAFSQAPFPDRLLVGVAEDYYWDIETVLGRFDSSRVTVDYVGADLESSQNRNDIAFDSATPALAEAESLDEPFTNLFTTDDSVEDPDLFSSGLLTGEKSFTKRYLAVALSPKVPADGVSYIPTAFSPLSVNEEDQVLKFYSEKVIPDGFSFKIYDRFGDVLYETNDLSDAQTNGWNGLLKSGKPASGGYYFYSAKFEFFNGRKVSKTGQVMLIR
ncbi:MAG: gliding motility-associated C-terminal domain-containing protein [Imperialibacter sp.]|uniref:T9SS type B sorting domain-containing protein n=1 Tax=Imperialibacter sp. TaxID=2038411 RepID=UPI0032EF475C